ncbi:ATP-binding protein [Streptomyces sp. NPDC047022]|uniref:ATP-binding protein n=1 Tax=Streptomyces sp. NPDC047022 TaxID=3155737 RepID=UPI0033C16228
MSAHALNAIPDDRWPSVSHDGKATPSAGGPSASGSPSWWRRCAMMWARTMEPVRPLSAPAARATGQEASWPLVSEPVSVGHARRLVTAQLAAWELDGDLADTAELLVSELVTNALRHAPGPVRLNLRASGSRLRCEVEDTNDSHPVRRVVCAEDAESGRGVELLELLSAAWGSFHTPTGKTSWFELEPPLPADGA